MPRPVCSVKTSPPRAIDRASTPQSGSIALVRLPRFHGSMAKGGRIIASPTMKGKAARPPQPTATVDPGAFRYSWEPAMTFSTSRERHSIFVGKGE